MATILHVVIHRISNGSFINPFIKRLVLFSPRHIARWKCTANPIIENPFFYTNNVDAVQSDAIP